MQEVCMKNLASRTGIGVGVSATIIAVVWAYVLPYGYPWPSLAWMVVACAAAVGAANSRILPTPRMTDVIGDVEGESPRAGQRNGRVIL
jgi:hypothetical protein